MRRFFGMKGYYIALVTEMIMLYGAPLIYYQLMVQILFPVIMNVKGLISHEEVSYIDTRTDFSKFSVSWLSIFLFVPVFLL
mmetsp:Transcript_14340/g.16580  ORF Transcript_14340/g.16580 Transcript_14340/m.16580 type:complete len:81 (+) Transcript_14340:220-462(+)